MKHKLHHTCVYKYCEISSGCLGGGGGGQGDSGIEGRPQNFRILSYIVII